MSQEINDNTKVNQVQNRLDGKGKTLHCEDCKYIHNWNQRYLDTNTIFCKKSIESKVEWLVMKSASIMDRCTDMRLDENRCGREGKLFESKD